MLCGRYLLIYLLTNPLWKAILFFWPTHVVLYVEEIRKQNYKTVLFMKIDENSKPSY